MNLVLNDLIGGKDGSMNISIFKCRYSGFVGVLTAQMHHADGIESRFNGGDTDYETVDSPLHSLGWFPIVYVETADEVVPALHKKLEKISAMSGDKREWITSVEWLGALIEQDKHWPLLRNLKEGNPLCQIYVAYEALSQYF